MDDYRKLYLSRREFTKLVNANLSDKENQKIKATIEWKRYIWEEDKNKGYFEATYYRKSKARGINTYMQIKLDEGDLLQILSQELSTGETEYKATGCSVIKSNWAIDFKGIEVYLHEYAKESPLTKIKTTK